MLKEHQHHKSKLLLSPYLARRGGMSLTGTQSFRWYYQKFWRCLCSVCPTN